MMLTTTPDQAPQVATLTNKLANATHQVEALTNELASSETAMNMLRADLTKAKQIAAALARATLDSARGGSSSDKERIPMPEKFDGTRSKLRAFLTQLQLKVATYPNEYAKLRLAINCLTGDAIDQVQSYMENDKVHLANLAALITILDNVGYVDIDHHVDIDHVSFCFFPLYGEACDRSNGTVHDLYCPWQL